MNRQAEAQVNHFPNINFVRAFSLGALFITFIFLQTLSSFARPESLAPLAEKISPSVVNITTSTLVEGRTAPQGIVPEGSPFEDFFREFQDRNNNENGNRPRRSSALGSGFVISEDGYVVTNNHVIEGADEILIEFFNGSELKATVIGTDAKTDIALLKVEAEKALPFVPFGDSDTANVGDWVIAMGNPLGQGFSVSAGIVSARNRALSGSYDDYIQLMQQLTGEIQAARCLTWMVKSLALTQQSCRQMVVRLGLGFLWQLMS
jgi:serine protease Do